MSARWCAALALLLTCCGGSVPTGEAKPSASPRVPSRSDATMVEVSAAAATTDPSTTGPVVTIATPSSTIAQSSVLDASQPTAPPPPSSMTAAPPSLDTGGDPAAGASCVRSLPLEVRAAQVVMTAVYGDNLEAARSAAERSGIGGVVVMTWPESASSERLLALKNAGPIPLLVAVDEEGGNVQRMRRLGVLPSAAESVRNHSSAELEAMIAGHAGVLAATGIDVVFAPVVDVAPSGEEGPIEDRAFSADPWVVAEYAAAVVRGWQSAGIVPVLKHFPGHGRASADTHHSTAVTPPLDDLRGWDLLPYTQFYGASDVGVMVGHLTVPGLTDPEGVPASLSSAAITALLRAEYGFGDSLVVTDALDMEAVASQYDVAQAAVRSLEAGADVALHMTLSDASAIVQAIVAAVAAGTLSEARLDEAVGRVLASKGLEPCVLSAGFSGG